MRASPWQQPPELSNQKAEDGIWTFVHKCVSIQTNISIGVYCMDSGLSVEVNTIARYIWGYITYHYVWGSILINRWFIKMVMMLLLNKHSVKHNQEWSLNLTRFFWSCSLELKQTAFSSNCLTKQHPLMWSHALISLDSYKHDAAMIL